MKAVLRAHWPFLVLVGILTPFHLWGAGLVPFHPDESTYLYMSSDFETLLSDPASLAWQAGAPLDPRQIYRLRDAPLTRYLTGLFRSFSGLEPLRADWDWSASWAANRRAGALPEQGQLHLARQGLTLLLPFSLGFVYLTGRKIGGTACGLLAAFLLGSHTLTLLHGRRAMAEGPLILGITFFLWSMTHGRPRAWLVGLAMALAFNAKHSTLALFPIGLLAALWLPSSKRTARVHWLNAGTYLAVFGLVTLALNPLLWADPGGALRASWASRLELVAGQTTEFGAQNPEWNLRSPGDRLAAILAHLYLTPPVFAEAGNYLPEIASSTARYLAVPGHQWMRGLVAGGILLALTLFGAALAAPIWRSPQPGAPKRLKTLVLVAGLAQLAGLVAVVPLPFQRYSIPLVPFVCLWIAYGLSQLLRALPASLRQGRRFSSAA